MSFVMFPLPGLIFCLFFFRKQMDEEEDEDDEGISINAGGVTGVEKTKKQKQGPGRDTAISEWKLNGSRSNQKQVVNFVRQLNIQTDNLCQFLPQDKVHEFSKLNEKGQLISREHFGVFKSTKKPTKCL